MKLLLLGPLVLLLPFATVTPNDIYGAITSAVTAAVALAGVLGVSWIVIGRGLWHRATSHFETVEEVRKEQAEMKTKQDHYFEEDKREKASIREAIGSLTTVTAEHTTMLHEHAKALEYFRGKSDAHKEIAETAQAAALIAHDLKEIPPS